MEWIVPAPAGGGTDTAARRLAQILEENLGETISIRNVAGGGGTVGMAQFLEAPDNGYTLAAVWNGPITTVPAVQSVPYSQDDYVPIVSTSATGYTMCVKPDFPAETGEEFLQELAENPDQYSYGNDGVGGTMQLAAERLFQEYDASAKSIPFGGAGETMQNFLGGHVDIYGGSISTIQPHVNSGEAKCLIVTSEEPVEALPQATSMEELGHPEFATGLWRAILGPEGISDARREKIASAVETAMQNEDYIEFLAEKGEVPMVMTGEELAEYIRNERESLEQTAKNLGIAQN